MTGGPKRTTHEERFWPRVAIKADSRSIVAIARAYGVSTSAISHLRHGRNWTSPPAKTERQERGGAA